MGVVSVKQKTWDQIQDDIDALCRDLTYREVTAQLPADTIRSLAKIGESLNLSAQPLLRFLVLLGAIYVKDLDPKSLNLLRALTEGDVNLEGPGYDLPF